MESNMRMKLAAAALLIAQCLSACGPGGVGGTGVLRSGPSDSDLAQALLARHPGHPIVAAKLDQCHDGRGGEKGARACGFCFVAVGVAYSDNVFRRGAYLKAVRRSGDVVFRRADSAEKAGERAGWLASRIKHDATVESAPLTEELMTRAGHHRRPGLGTFVRWTVRRPTSLGPLGEVDEPVARTFAADAKLRNATADLVGACERTRGQWKGRPPASAHRAGSDAKA
jgi:hypothetical protein